MSTNLSRHSHLPSKQPLLSFFPFLHFLLSFYILIHLSISSTDFCSLPAHFAGRLGERSSLCISFASPNSKLSMQQSKQSRDSLLGGRLGHTPYKCHSISQLALLLLLQHCLIWCVCNHPNWKRTGYSLHKKCSIFCGAANNGSQVLAKCINISASNMQRQGDKGCDQRDRETERQTERDGEGRRLRDIS